LDEQVLWPWDPPLIEGDRLTVPELLDRHGYDTACIGKWHLGWRWPTDDDQPASGDIPIGEHAADRRQERASHIDFSAPLAGGPTDRGFDYYFGDDVPNFPPYTWIENDRIVDQPIIEKPEAIFGADGPMSPGWTLEAVMPELTAQAVEYIETTGDTPFFLYFPLTAPHTPIVPTRRFRGRSDAGEYGDYVCEVDWAVGEVLDALDRRGIADETLVVFTSDNGPEHLDQLDDATAYNRIREYDHYSMGGWRGIKRDLWEGGHRIPFIACWPGEIPSGTESSETICQTDLLRTVASIVDADLPADTGEDSYDILPALRGNSYEGPIREATVLHAANGNLAIRKDEWVLVDAETGDVSGEPDWFKSKRKYETHGQPGGLYNLAEDPQQRENRHADRPVKVEELRTILTEYIEAGRSVPPV
jgi:arylsulfatase A-like enzyme